MNWSQITQRERDALVAEKVMGWSFVEVDGKKIWANNLCTMIRTMILSPYPFSTDIQFAWQVMEKSKEWGGMFIHVLQGGVDVETVRPDTGEIIRVYAPTAPEAICRAALRATGVDVQ